MPIGEFLRRLAYLVNRRRHDEALKREMEAHRDLLHSTRPFGNARRLREDAHDVWGWRWLDDIVRDVRLAGRLLLRSPGFTLVAVCSLAAGFVLVAMSLIVVNAYLLRPLPYAGADRLYNVMYAPAGPWEPRGVSALDWKSVEDVVEYPITARGDTFYLGDGAYAEATRGLRVTLDFIRGLDVRAFTGRTLEARDWQSDSDAVALIGHRLWRDRYGSDPTIVGRLIRAGAESRRGAVETLRVIGVLRPGFYFGRDSSATVDIMRPLTEPAQAYLVRLRSGVSPELAERRLTDAVRAIARDLPSDWTGVHLDSTRERYIKDLRPIVQGATVAAAAIMALVCINLAVLALLRSMRRQKEWAVRTALGSGRWPLARMLLIETLMLVGAALVTGLSFAHLCLGFLAPVIEQRLGRPAPGGPASLAIDPIVLLLAAGVAVLVSLSLAFLPMWAPWQGTLGDVLQRDRSRSTDGRAMRRLRSALLTCEVAGTLVVLIGGGLLVRSTFRMLETDLGFEPDRFLRSRVMLRSADYADGPSYFRFYERFVAAVSARASAPVVFSSWPPFAEFPTVSAETPDTMGSGVTAGLVRVGGGYFGAAGIPLREGRDVTAADEGTDALVAVVSETLARRLWPDGRGVGRQIRPVEAVPEGVRTGAWRTVVGVVADVRQGYTDDETSDVYLPFSPEQRGRYGSFLIRTDMSASAVWPLLRSVAAEIDPNAVISEPQVAASGNEELAGARFLAQTMAIVSAGAVLLAGLGIYGVTSYSAGQRAREVAVRVALGASRQAIRLMFWREIALVLITGAALGLACALITSRVLESSLYGVSATDLPTISTACAVLGAIGVIAAWGPVRRTSRQDPMAVLKEG